MTMEDIKAELKKQYPKHEDFDEMINDLSNGDSIEYWASRLCDKDFNYNKDIAKKLYKLVQCESSRECCSLAKAINDNLKDNKWSMDIYNKAIELAENTDDLIDIAKDIIKIDKITSQKVLKEAISKIQDAYDSRICANFLVEELGNTDEAKKYYQKAIDKANGYSQDEFDIAIDIANILKDNEWAIQRLKVVYKIAISDKDVSTLLDIGRKYIELGEKSLAMNGANITTLLSKEGYYCDVYYYLLEELCDVERAERYKDKHLENMRNDYEEYGSCEEMFEDE
jgi:tetratricopeptide (TPR) repeat protein